MLRIAKTYQTTPHNVGSLCHAGKEAKMRGSRFVVLRMCCSPLSYFAAIASPSNCGGGFSYVQHVRGGERREHSPRSPCKGDEGDRSSSRWWAVRNRPTKFLSVQQARESRTRVLTRRHVLLAKGVLQRLRRWFALLLDITTLKHIRQLRQARQVCVIILSTEFSVVF